MRRWTSALLLSTSVACVACLDERTRAGEHADPGQEHDAGSDAAHGEARLVVEPSLLTLAEVPVGEQRTAIVELRNEGDAPLVLTGVALDTTRPETLTLELHRGDEVVTTPLTLAPASEPQVPLTLVVAYEALDRAETTAKIEFFGEGPPTLAQISFRGTPFLECLDVRPPLLEFRRVLIGGEEVRQVELANCGTTDVVVRSIGLDGETSPDFGLVDFPVGLSDDCLGVSGDTCEGEVSLPPDQTLLLGVRYRPTEADQDRGEIVVTGDLGETDTVRVGLVGEPTNCLAVAEARSADGDFAEYLEPATPLGTGPFVRVPLRGTSSTCKTCEVAGHAWRILAGPEGSRAVVVDGPGPGEAALAVDIVGSYAVELTVTDTCGFAWTSPLYLDVVPPAWSYVELVWKGVQGTEDGAADLDLHVLRSPGSSFCAPADCNVDNPNPDWGEQGQSFDDPTFLAHDPTVGPEGIWVPDRAGTLGFSVDAYYRSGPEDGPVEATIRIFVEGDVKGEFTQRFLGPVSFWVAASLMTTGTGSVTESGNYYEDASLHFGGRCPLPDP